LSQKVFEFAKELGLETIALMDKIKQWNLPVKSHMATLDEDLIHQIRSKLAEGEAEKAAVKKVVRKKKVTSAASAKATIEPPVKATTKAKATTAVPAAKDAVATKKKKTTTTKTVMVTRKQSGAEKATTLVVKSELEGDGSQKILSRKSTVIRKKTAEEAEAERQAQQALQQELKEREAQAAAAAAEAAASPERSNAESGGGAVLPGVPPKRRTNIIGRMDLSKARPPAGAGGGMADGGRPTRPGGPVRNIRTGFYAMPEAVTEVATESFDDKERRKEKEKARKPGAGNGREEEAPAFNASDFRKREIVFQPKKKRVALKGEFRKTQITTPKASKRVVSVFGTMSVADLAQAIGQKAPVLTKKLMSGGVMAALNTQLDYDTISLIVPEFGYEAENVQQTPDETLAAGAFGDLSAEAQMRPAVVTVMGHVDHGKTSLLDAIRKANVASGEAGGITQHIGAYQVKIPTGQLITFIDTPGHEAFTAMRARGAKVTDIAIVVVAADDGVMPQTAEAISHAKAAEVPIIIAVNKMDRPGANMDRIKQQLTEYEIVPEEWGGTNIFCPVSALEKTGIKELLEQIVVVAELEDLKANPNRSAAGTVIEAKLEKGRGAVATLLVSEGTLRVGDLVVAGLSSGRVRAMVADTGDRLKEAGPSVPVEVLGFDDAPAAGDSFYCVKDEAVAQTAIAEMKRLRDVSQQTEKAMTLEALFSKVRLGEVKELPIVLKADVSGSVEAIRGMLDKVGTDEVKVKIIHSAVGGISESDVLLAGTAKGLILGFNVRPDTVAMQKAKERSVEIKTYTIVYNLIDDMKKALAGLLKPEEVEKATGRAEVREVFTVPKVGNIAGCAVIDGKVSRSDQVRLLRDGVVVYQGKISSLKRFKDDAKEVASGYECGIGIENFNDIKPGDAIETFIVEKIVREL
jgi:translation initiation factor IF-2